MQIVVQDFSLHAVSSHLPQIQILGLGFGSGSHEDLSWLLGPLSFHREYKMSFVDDGMWAENLEEFLFEEKKPVTYKWLSR